MLRFFLVAASVFLAGCGARQAPALSSAAPIDDGWTEIQPRMNLDVPPGVGERHTFVNGVHHFWVEATDPSTFPGRDSGCRSEARIYNDYTSGVHQFQGEFLVEAGTNNVSLFQIFGNRGRATSLMLWATCGGSLSHYSDAVLHTGIYNTWTRLNVIHNTDTGAIDVYINGEHRATYKDNGPHNHYFKFGVYRQREMSPHAGVYFRNIHFFEKKNS